MLCFKRSLKYIFPIIFLLYGAAAHAAPENFPCSDPKPATQAQVDAADGGISLGQLICPSDVTLGISNDAGKAKEYLNSLPKRCTSVGPGCWAPPTKERIDKLDNTFAICAAKFFQEYQKAYGPLRMSSAFRCGPNSPATIQCDRAENGRAGGATASNHQLGLAIDINPHGGNSSYETLWEYAQKNPKFGICFPYKASDHPHLTLAGSNTGESAKCAAQGVTKPCDGLPFTASVPSGSITDARLTPNTTSNLSSISQNLAKIFTPPPPNPATQALAQQTMPVQNYFPTSPTPSNTIGSVNFPGAISVASDIDTGIINTNTNSNNTSALDLINAIAYPTTSPATTATGTVLALNDALNNTVTLHDTQPSPTSGTAALTATTTYEVKNSGQTFTSLDLKDASVAPRASVYGSTFSILENLKQTLLLILKWLQPFGGIILFPTTASAVTATM